MRISDWSSDVCSSDLPPPKNARALPSRDARSDLLLLQQIADLGQQPLFNARLRRCGRCFRLRWFLEIVDGAYHQEDRSEEHTSELQSLMRISYAVFCLKKKRHIVYDENLITYLKK